MHYMVDFTKKRIDAVKAKNAKSDYENFGFYVFIRLILIAAFPIIGAVAALGLGVFAAPALIPLAVFASNSDRMASFIERFENQPLKFFRDGMVVIGNFLNAISPSPSPAYSTEESQIGDAVNARNIQMVVVCILLSFTAAFFPPAIPVVIGIAALYMVCTVACRTADAAHSVENSKEALGTAFGLNKEVQIANDSLLRKLVNEFDDKDGYDKAMLNNPEKIKNCVQDIKNKTTFSKQIESRADLAVKEKLKLKEALGTAFSLNKEEQIANDSLLRKLVNEFDNKAGYDKAMLNNPEKIKNCVKDIKNKTTFAKQIESRAELAVKEKLKLKADCKNLETIMQEFGGTTFVFTDGQGQDMSIEGFMNKHKLVFGENAIPDPKSVNDDDVAEFLTTTLQANFHLKKEVNEETKKLKKITILDPLENATNLKDSIAKKIEAASTSMGMDAPTMEKTDPLLDTQEGYIEKLNKSQISKNNDRLETIRALRRGEKAVAKKIKDQSSGRKKSAKTTPPKQGAGNSGVG